MAGSLNKDNLSYDSILRLQQLLAEGMKLHDPAQAESMREMLKKMRVSRAKTEFQFTSPKPPAQARRTRRGATGQRRDVEPFSFGCQRGKRGRTRLLARLLHPLYRKVLVGTPPSEPSAKDKRHKRVSARPSKSKTAKPPASGPSRRARVTKREPLALWILSRPWTRTCLPVHLILVHQLRHENHQDGRRAGHQAKPPSSSKRRSLRTRPRWRPRRQRASSSN